MDFTVGIEQAFFRRQFYIAKKANSQDSLLINIITQIGILFGF